MITLLVTPALAVRGCEPSPWGEPAVFGIGTTIGQRPGYEQIGPIVVETVIFLM